MLACMLQNLEAIGCLGVESSALTTPLSATQQGDRSHVLTGNAGILPQQSLQLKQLNKQKVFTHYYSVQL